MASVTVENILKENILKCVEIYINTFSAPPWNEDLEYGSVQAYINNWINLNNSIGLLVKNYSEKICGFCLGIIKPGIAGDIFYLEEFCIDTEWQNSGIGNKLLRELENELLNCNIKRIVLNTSSASYAKVFYENHGYICISNIVMMGKLL